MRPGPLRPRQPSPRDRAKPRSPWFAPLPPGPSARRGALRAFPRVLNGGKRADRYNARNAGCYSLPRGDKQRLGAARKHLRSPLFCNDLPVFCHLGTQALQGAERLLPQGAPHGPCPFGLQSCPFRRASHALSSPAEGMAASCAAPRARPLSSVDRARCCGVWTPLAPGRSTCSEASSVGGSDLLFALRIRYLKKPYSRMQRRRNMVSSR